MLPAPFLLLGLFRCGQLAFAGGGPAAPHPPSLHDRPTALAAAGWLAALAVGLWLSGLP